MDFDHSKHRGFIVENILGLVENLIMSGQGCKQTQHQIRVHLVFGLDNIKKLPTQVKYYFAKTKRMRPITCPQIPQTSGKSTIVPSMSSGSRNDQALLT